MADEKRPFHNPFAALSGFLKPASASVSVDQPTSIKSQAPSLKPPAAPAKPIPRAVVRFERAGRGGKAVTVIDHLEVPDRDEWLKSLKSSLGCGGTLEGDRLVLQGDQRERLRGLLAARGVRKITVA